MPTKDPRQSYITIKQSPSESFLEFIDRLHAVVENQTEDQELQQKMIMEVAQNNANDVCKRIILGLPVSPPPTLDLLIETCTKQAILDPDEQQKGPGLRGRIAAPANIPPQPPVSGKVKCFQCGQEGHVMYFCPFKNKTLHTPAGAVGEREKENVPELEILGLVRMKFCVRFNHSGVAGNKTINVTPNHIIYRKASS
ncbi:hypothetical protein HGM15179_018751 [Zosterops borbonicus]|uniref:Gag polyprotein n=1 Tax=Zosterops borbonicus TaxID=364589 RepID=A0A8K1D9E4_9PASS|nr:hypothetical protein HGM15179_018751 [Zosterops borbonicus]